MAWIKLLETDALGEGERQVAEVEGQKILLLKHNNKLYALQHNCPHMGASLKRGKLEGNSIVCPLHRSVFDLESGAAQEWAPWPPVVGSVLGAVKQERDLAVYPTKVENGAVWIEFDQRK
jgi:nitrite reductase/ring-hydroxylating ferredoxin subunit